MYMLHYMKRNLLDEDPRMLTIFFSVFVIFQFWNLFNAKRWGSSESVFKGFFANRAFLAIAFAIAAGQILIVQSGSRFFRTVPLSLKEWAAIIIATSFILWGGELFRLFARMKVKSA